MLFGSDDLRQKSGLYRQLLSGGEDHPLRRPELQAGFYLKKSMDFQRQPFALYSEASGLARLFGYFNFNAHQLITFAF